MKLSVDLFHPKIKEEEVVVDTTVQEKNIPFPTDAKLTKKVIDTCRKIANKEDISLRQSYIRTAPDLLRQASNRKSPRQKKKAVKATRRIRTIGRAMLRDHYLYLSFKPIFARINSSIITNLLIFVSSFFA